MHSYNYYFYFIYFLDTLFRNMPKSSTQKRKTFTYGGLKKAKDDKNGWNKVSESDSSKPKIPKVKGIWSNATSVSPFKKSPLKDPKLSIKTSKKDDPFNFDDSEMDCFNFKENGVKISPKKGPRTPSKLLNSPRSPTTVNPRLKGKTLPDDSVTINVGDLTPKKGKGVTKKTTNKVLKKGTLAALKAELTSPNKKSPKKSPVKGNLADLKAKIKTPVKKTKESPNKSPKKGSLAALKAKLESPKKKETVPNTKTKTESKQTSPKKSPVKKASAKVVSKKLKSPKKSSPQKIIKKTNLRTTKTSQKRKVDPPEQPSAKRKAPKKRENRLSPKKTTSKVSPVKQKPNLDTKVVKTTKKATRTNNTTSVSQNDQVTSPVKRKAGRPRKNQNNSQEEPPAKRKAVAKETEVSDRLSSENCVTKTAMDFEESVDESKDSLQNEDDNVLVNESSTEITMDDSTELPLSGSEMKGNESAKDNEETIDDDQSTEQHIDESQENQNEDQIEEEEEDDDDDNEEEPLKTKSVFSYYDKQKKNTDSIFGDSKKNIVIFDDEDGDCDLNQGSHSSRKHQVEPAEKKLKTPEKTAPSEETAKADSGNSHDVDEKKKTVKVHANYNFNL